MHRSYVVPGTMLVTLLNIAVVESLSVSVMAALLTWFVELSFCATKAARDEVTTSRAIRMKVSANADSWMARLFRERPPRRRVRTTGNCVPFGLIQPYRAAAANT